MIFTTSKSCDCYFNLALEEHFLRSRNDDVFMLWQNEKTIVVGKNQNTLSEINIDFVKKNDIRVVRRITGGGAVYHDMGNINFSYITNAEADWESDFSRFTAPVIRALDSIGIKAEMSGRNDIVVCGRKISGNAQTMLDGRLLHHGTLLLDTDMTVLERALNPDPIKIKSKGIKSVASRVVNICDLLDYKITAGDLMDLIRKEVSETLGTSDYVLSEEDIAAANKLADEKYRTWDWNFGYSPKYSFRKKGCFECGIVEACLDVKDGVIIKADFFGDYLSTADTCLLSNALCGVCHKYNDIKKALSTFEIHTFFQNLTLDNLLEILM